MLPLPVSVHSILLFFASMADDGGKGDMDGTLDDVVW
jgi:hypothetical protein